MATEDTPSNEADLTYGDGMKTLNITTREEIRYMNDKNVLMMLKFFKVPLGWLKEILPKDIERILNLLPQY